MFRFSFSFEFIALLYEFKDVIIDEFSEVPMDVKPMHIHLKLGG